MDCDVVSEGSKKARIKGHQIAPSTLSSSSSGPSLKEPILLNLPGTEVSSNSAAVAKARRPVDTPIGGSPVQRTSRPRLSTSKSRSLLSESQAESPAASPFPSMKLPVKRVNGPPSPELAEGYSQIMAHLRKSIYLYAQHHQIVHV